MWLITVQDVAPDVDGRLVMSAPETFTSEVNPAQWLLDRPPNERWAILWSHQVDPEIADRVRIL